LASKLRQFLRLERATIVYAQGVSEDQKFAAQRSFGCAKNRFTLSH